MLCGKACRRTVYGVNGPLLVHQSCDQTWDNYWQIGLHVNAVRKGLGVAGAFTRRLISLAFGDFGRYVCVYCLR